MSKIRWSALPMVALAAAACSEARTPPAPEEGLRLAPLASVSGRAVPSSYIVVLKPGMSARLVAATVGAGPKHVYSAALNGFAAQLSKSQLATLRRNLNVKYIEPDQVVNTDVTQSMDATGQPWALDRIDQRALPLSKTYTYATTASTVKVYVIDTGIEFTHPDFGGRAAFAFDALGGKGVDCNGHGTHVSGTIGGLTFGVAKGVQLRAVRVLDCTGSGTTSGVIAGLDFVAANVQKPAVANLSLNTGLSTALNTAVTNLANAGVFMAVAAGNNSGDACSYSPSSALAAFTTAASTSTDQRASYSNYGTCVDAYAPGSSIMSDYLGGATATLSGTSMAAPHVAGIAALYKATYGDAATSVVSSWIVGNATAGVIIRNKTGTPNLLAFKASL